jgi:hypothetical protein
MHSLSGAATNGYLYYVAGALGDTGQAQPADGTLTGDNGVFSVLVADVDIAAGTVSNGVMLECLLRGRS